MPSRLPFVISVALSLVGMVRAEDVAELDWGTWRRMPVFCNGRVMPLDTFARETATTICGRPDPTLLPPEVPAHAAEKGPNGTERQVGAGS